MSELTIRNIEPLLKDRLQKAAAAHGRSMEAEALFILRNALAAPASSAGLGSRIHARFAAVSGVELNLPERSVALEISKVFSKELQGLPT